MKIHMAQPSVGFLIETLLSVLTVCILFTVVGGDEEQTADKLQVEIVEKPERCDITSQKGNVLKMHYTGRLLDGTKFDSRSVAGARALDVF